MMFKEFKAGIEQVIIQKSNIIITTCRSAVGKRLENCEFIATIIDEAGQAQELEALGCLMKADKVVLIGDPKQLGPIYMTQVNDKVSSILSRLYYAKYPCYQMIDT